MLSDSKIREIITMVLRHKPTNYSIAEDQMDLCRRALGLPLFGRDHKITQEQVDARMADLKEARSQIAQAASKPAIAATPSLARKPFVATSKPQPAAPAKPQGAVARRAALLAEYQAQAPGAPRRAFFAQHEKDLFLAARESQPIKS